MKKIKKEGILIILFIVYIFQCIILFLNNEKINTIENNNERIETIQDIAHNNDLGDIIREIDKLGFNIESIEKENDKISANIFASSSNNDVVKSLENLKLFNCFIEEYTISKNDNIYVRIKVKIP